MIEINGLLNFSLQPIRHHTIICGITGDASGHYGNAGSNSSVLNN
ncbi:hypothetical protein AT05_08470 [Schleiferia thermophila str. Yellowstone]|nr:hypothetical protein AT05_08470 [Schleiferia thermophila str. Yellowstone]